MSSHPCPFVRAVVAGDELEVDRLNRADGNPAEPAVLDWLRLQAIRASLGLTTLAELAGAHSDRPGSARGE